jgi:hypothetical protein
VKYSNYFYKNSIAFFLVMFLVADGYSQNLHTIDIVESQPLIYRDKDGNYIGCGIRVVFATNTPTPLSFGDISVNLYISSSKPIGLAKALFSDSQDGSVNSSVKKLPIQAFMLAKSSGQAIKLFNSKKSDEEGALLASTTPEDALDLLMDFILSKPVEIGLQLKSEKTMRIFRLTVPRMKIEEVKSFNLCFGNIKNNL